MSKHTPGPWTTDTGGDVTRTDGATLLTREQPSDCTLDESFANAQLAAAAPELLEALANLLAVVRGEGGTQPDAHGIAERAIAKAVGGKS